MNEILFLLSYIDIKYLRTPKTCFIHNILSGGKRQSTGYVALASSKRSLSRRCRRKFYSIEIPKNILGSLQTPLLEVYLRSGGNTGDFRRTLRFVTVQHCFVVIKRFFNLFKRHPRYDRVQQRISGLVRQGLKLGYLLSGGRNASDFDKKNIRVISPRFLSVSPTSGSRNSQSGIDYAKNSVENHARSALFDQSSNDTVRIG